MLREFKIYCPDYEPMIVPHLLYPIMSDVVFYKEHSTIEAEDVRKMLIDHDGYPSNIIVEEVK
jgi:hypothetical protein